MTHILEKVRSKKFVISTLIFSLINEYTSNMIYTHCILYTIYIYRVNILRSRCRMMEIRQSIVWLCLRKTMTIDLLNWLIKIEQTNQYFNLCIYLTHTLQNQLRNLGHLKMSQKLLDEIGLHLIREAKIDKKNHFA